MAATPRPGPARLARPERRRRARQLRQQGQTLRQIAAQLGASPSTISTDLRAPNPPPETTPAPPPARSPPRRPLARLPTRGRPPLALVRAALRQLSR